MNEDLELIHEGGRWFLYDQFKRRKYPLANGMNPDEDLEGFFTENYRLNGRVVEYMTITDYDGEIHVFTGKKMNNPRGQRQGPPNRKREEIDRNRKQRPAVAPYNFIPLNKQVVIHEAAGNHAEFDPKLYSGYVNVTLTTETPCFIRSEKHEERFFSVGKGHPFVPGSSFRGVIRSLFEVISYSKMDFVIDSQFSHRSMAAMAKRLNDAYEEAVPDKSTQDNNTALIKAGYLKYENRKFFIVPAGKPTKIPEESQFQKPPQAAGKGYIVFTGFINEKKHQWKINGPIQGKELPIDERAIRAYRDDAHRNTYSRIKFKGKVYDGFQLNLLKEAKENHNKWKDGYPVFYNTAPDNDQIVVSFGHTPYYRVPFGKSVTEHINHPDLEEQTDFTQAIFGSTKMAGRVQFGDLDMITDKEWAHPVRTRKLMTPKPTTFQHYLEQPRGIATKLDDLVHWGDGTADQPVPIRGHKMYWHRGTEERKNKGQDWGASKEDREKGRAFDEKLNRDLKNKRIKDKKEAEWKTVQVPLIPVQKDSKFKGRIYFDNLSQVELGGLLTALELPPDCRQKIGLGKPLGLGSVRVECEVTRIHRERRYSRLLDESGSNWNTGEEGIPGTNFLKQAFSDHLLQQLNGKEAHIWLIPRLAELRALLTFDESQVRSTDWLEETRYMEMERPKPTPFEPPSSNDGKHKWNEYKHRPVLPRPRDVQQHFKQRQKPSNNGNRNA